MGNKTSNTNESAAVRQSKLKRSRSSKFGQPVLVVRDSKWDQILLVIGYCRYYKCFPVSIFESIFNFYYIQTAANYSDIAIGAPEVIGAVGLENYDGTKNTSIINAIVQCLSNTPSISQYFTSHKFKLNFECDKNGIYNIEQSVLIEFGIMLNEIWNGEFKVIMSRKFIELYNDYIFEMENKINANNFLHNILSLCYEECGSSMICQTFDGEIKESKKCTICSNQYCANISFEYLLMPSITKNYKSNRIPFIIDIYNQKNRPKKHVFYIAQQSTLLDVSYLIYKLYNLDSNQCIRYYEFIDYKIETELIQHNTNIQSLIQPNENGKYIQFACYITDQYNINDYTLRIFHCNKSKQSFGLPFVIQMPLNYQLTNLILHKMIYERLYLYFKNVDNILKIPPEFNQHLEWIMLLCNHLPYTLHIVKKQFTGFCAVSFVSEKIINVDSEIINIENITTQQHHIQIEWNEISMSTFIKLNIFDEGQMIQFDGSYNTYKLKIESMKIEQIEQPENNMISLYECFDYFENNEINGQCINNSQHKIKIKRKIIHLPNILIIAWNDENVFDQIIHYPLNQFDLGSFEGNTCQKNNKAVYKLYGGIYFDKHLKNRIYSIVRNLYNDKWYSFRDDVVKKVIQPEIMDMFYVKALFYIRESQLRV